MNGNEYLMQIRILNRKIKNKMSELHEMRTLAESVRAVSYDRERVQRTSDPDALGSSVMRIIECERELDQMIDQYIDKKREIIGVIEKLTDPDEYDMLYLYYVDEKSWTEISEILSYSYRGIMKKRRKALETVESFI